MRLWNTTPLKFFAFLLVVAGALFCTRGLIFRAIVSYKMVGVRTEFAGFTRKPDFDNLEKGAVAEAGDPEELIEKALIITSERLCFASTNTATNPNRLLTHKRADCVGYAAFFKSVFEDVSRDQKRDLTVYHVVGKLHFLGIDIHPLFSSEFFKDHDYNIIVDHQNKRMYFVDPSLHDFLGIGFVNGSDEDVWTKKTHP